MAYPKSFEEQLGKKREPLTKEELLEAAAMLASMYHPAGRALRTAQFGVESAADLYRAVSDAKKERAMRSMVRKKKKPKTKRRVIKEPPPVRMSTYESQRSTERMNKLLNRAARSRARK